MKMLLRDLQKMGGKFITQSAELTGQTMMGKDVKKIKGTLTYHGEEFFIAAKSTGKNPYEVCYVLMDDLDLAYDKFLKLKELYKEDIKNNVNEIGAIINSRNQRKLIYRISLNLDFIVMLLVIINLKYGNFEDGSIFAPLCLTIFIFIALLTIGNKNVYIYKDDKSEPVDDNIGWIN